MSQPHLSKSSITIHGCGAHGLGISSSSNSAVLYEAMEYYFRKGLPIDKETVAKAALLFERRDRRGGAVAANDVYPIACGGVVKVITAPNARVGQVEVDGEVAALPVKYDRDWIAGHVLVALNPRGERHDAPGLLARLFGHPQAGQFVEEISALTDKACHALECCDFQALADSVNCYRAIFNEWSDGAHLANVRKFANRMQRAWRWASQSFAPLEWKPPGAGGTESLIVLVPNREASEWATKYFAEENWWVQPALVTDGVVGEHIENGRGVRITAGHRIDFVGAADLGADGRIRVTGRCCGCAIEPRTAIQGPAVAQKSPNQSSYTCTHCQTTFDPVNCTVGWRLVPGGYEERVICSVCGLESMYVVSRLGCAAVEKHLPDCGVIERSFSPSLLCGHPCSNCGRTLYLAECETMSRDAKGPSGEGGPGYFYYNDYLICPYCDARALIGGHWAYDRSEY